MTGGALVWLVLGVVGFIMIPSNLQARSLRWWVLAGGVVLCLIASGAS